MTIHTKRFHKLGNRRLSLSNYRRALQIDELIAAEKYPNVAFLMQKFECSEATVLRAIETLRNDFGAEISYDRNRKGYYYAEPHFRLIASFSTEKQIIAAHLMTNLLKIVRDTPIYNQAIEVYKSLENELDGNEKLNAAKLENRIVFLGMNAVKIEDKLWNLIEESMMKNRLIQFDYYKNGRRYEVTVEPWQLVYFQGMWSLYCYNKFYKETRLYNLPAITNPKILEKTFMLPPDFDFEKHSKGSFGKFIGKENYSFKLKIRKEKTDYIRMYKWADDQKFEEQSDGTAIMTFTSNQYYPVLNWTLEKGMYVTPLAPQKLVDDWRENVLAMYEEVKNG